MITPGPDESENPSTAQTNSGQMVSTSMSATTVIRSHASIIYGSDQRRSLQVHKPEVCYPAQGFVLNRTKRCRTKPHSGDSGWRMFYPDGDADEPVTYWFHHRRQSGDQQASKAAGGLQAMG